MPSTQLNRFAIGFIPHIFSGVARRRGLSGVARHAKGHARRASAGDPSREGSEVGGGAKTAAGSPAAGCVIRFGATTSQLTVRIVPLTLRIHSYRIWS